MSQKAVISYQGAANYKVQVKLGEGAVGEVYRVMHKQTKELYALKRVSKISATMVSIHNHILINDVIKFYIFPTHFNSAYALIQLI